MCLVILIIAIDQYKIAKLYKKSYDELYSELNALKADLESAQAIKLQKYGRVVSKLPAPYQKWLEKEMDKE